MTSTDEQVKTGDCLKPLEGFSGYTFGEELVNSITHGIGTGLSVAALVLLVLRAVYHAPEEGRTACIVGFSLFGASLVILYLMSTLYHSLSFTRAEKVFQILDHSAIYILIAGSYSAFCFSVLYGPLGWTLFGTVWFLAAVGVTLDSVWHCRLQAVSLTLYLLMGWMIIFALRPILAVMPMLALKLLVAGGLCYTLGVIFFLLRNRWMHGIWHLFVMGGSVCHFFAAYWAI